MKFNLYTTCRYNLYTMQISFILLFKNKNEKKEEFLKSIFLNLILNNEIDVLNFFFIIIKLMNQIDVWYYLKMHFIISFLSNS